MCYCLYGNPVGVTKTPSGDVRKRPEAGCFLGLFSAITSTAIWCCAGISDQFGGIIEDIAPYARLWSGRAASENNVSAGPL